MIKKTFFMALLVITINLNIHASHKIVYFISPPRSLSVAFMRMMQAREDFCIMHEPSQKAWNLINSPSVVQNWFNADAPQTFECVKARILEQAQRKNVFVKEMSFAVKDFIAHDLELLKNPNIYFVFLIRSPHHVIISMYKKVAHVFDQIAHQMSDIIGYQATCQILDAVKENAVHPPYVIKTEDLYRNPEKTIRSFCDHVGIEFKPEALHWQSLGNDFTGYDEWHETKYKEHIHHWHGDAITSSGFGQPHSYEIDCQGNPTFAEITNEQHRDLCNKLYQEHMFYYKQLLQK